MNPMIMPMKELKNFYGNGLNYDNINFSDYFRTLSNEGRRQGFVSDSKFTQLKNQVGELLAGIISSFTGYESTSVMKDTANDLFVSVLYCLDMALFSFGSHEEALEFICENDVDAIYKKGQKVIKQYTFECISLLVKLKGNRINYPDRKYNSIFEGEIISYLKKYDSKYFAHGTKRVFSYNSVNGCGGYRGILHLRRYIENLIEENKFVNGYTEGEIQDICYGYCESNGLAYNDIGTNIYSVVLMNAVFAEMAGRGGLEVLKEDAQRVARLLKKLPEPEIRKILISTAEKVSDLPYVQKSMIRLAGHAINAINGNELNKIIYIGELK